MSTSHCRECGSEVCGHGHCPQCSPCTHCDGGDRTNKHFEEDDRPTAEECDAEASAQYAEDMREWERERMSGVKTGLDHTNNPDLW